MILLDGGGVVWNGTTPRVLMIPASRTLVEIEDDDDVVVLKGTTPSLTPDCREFVTDVLCRKLTVLGKVDIDVVTVIKVLDVTGVDAVLLDESNGESGITPTEEMSVCETGLLVVF